MVFFLKLCVFFGNLGNFFGDLVEFFSILVKFLATWWICWQPGGFLGACWIFRDLVDFLETWWILWELRGFFLGLSGFFGDYLSYATMISYVAYVGAMSFP